MDSLNTLNEGIKLFSDAHTHFRSMPYDAIGPFIKQIEKAGVELALIAGNDLFSSEREILSSRQFPILKACVGIHPWNADLYSGMERRLKVVATNTEVVALSEIGLDYVRRRDRETVKLVNRKVESNFVKEYIDKEIQRTAFRGQLRIAKELGLPVIVHDETYTQEVLDILEEEGNTKVGAAIHGFNRDLAYAKRCVEMGIYLSIGLGSIMELTGPYPAGPTDKEASKEAVRWLPLKWLLIESEGSSRNVEGVLEVAEKVAELKGLTGKEVGLATTQNLRKLTRL